MKIAHDFCKSRTCLVLPLTIALFFTLFLGGSSAESSPASGTGNIKSKFKSACASCHGQDGAGTPLGKSIKAPDLRSPEVQKHSDVELTKVISEGKGDMPSFRSSFDDKQIQALVQYVRGLASKTDTTPK